jgi:DnaJ-class molecular chaperone
MNPVSGIALGAKEPGTCGLGTMVREAELTWILCPDCEGRGFKDEGEQIPCKRCGTTGAIENPAAEVER